MPLLGKLLAFAALLALPLPLVRGQSAAGRITAASTAPASTINGYQPAWWKEAVVYQVYPRSFKDSNGDGIGDLNGITQKLDYLQQLGVNVIWLSPHFDSPNTDNGYDIRDYRKVMTEFGTMADFDRMLAAIKQRHMRLIIDLVVNHTSDEHHWFVESRKSKDNPYRDYYIWRDGKPDPAAPHGSAPPNNYPSYFSEPAWQFDPGTRQYYLHLFAIKQPDLNWDNAKVRQEVYSLMRFWLDKGVDGFRMDVIPLISKQPGLPDLTAAQLKDPSVVFASGPHLHPYLREMNREVLSKYDVMTVGEALGISLGQTPEMVDDRRHELDMIFNFDAISLAGGEHQWHPVKLADLKAIYDDHAHTLDRHSWDTVFLSNHDNPRVVSSFGDDAPAYRAPSAKLLATMILSLKGTPFLFQGDELGMTNYPFTAIEQFDDIEVKNAYKADVLTGKVPLDAFLANLRHTSRDNARTPMQWDASAHGGFTSAAHAWLAENPNYSQINAAREQADPQSVYHYFQKMIALRHGTPALVYGDYQDLDPASMQVYAYTRTLGAAHYLVVLNFSRTPIAYHLPAGVHPRRLVLANSAAAGQDVAPAKQGGAAAAKNTDTLHLSGWEARIYTY